MLSIVIPFHNEKENLRILYDELKIALSQTKEPAEIIFVNDNSTDKGEVVVEEIARSDTQIQVTDSAPPGGKGEALARGLQKAKGDIIIFMDGDVQHNPADISRLLERIRTGADLVNGRRTGRALTTAALYSGVFNFFLRTFFRSPFTDIGCGYKAFRSSISEKKIFQPNLYRLFPLMVAQAGYQVGEVVIQDRPRLYGRSKFGLTKLISGLLEVIRFFYWTSRR